MSFEELEKDTSLPRRPMPWPGAVSPSTVMSSATGFERHRRPGSLSLTGPGSGSEHGDGRRAQGGARDDGTAYGATSA
ncbi:hypothetical protein BIV23_25200 [Streptomyces monashensis]|uniref:Uncharacterized protein n=1 Tax=Streptomyces monashensis TaxID=1678012 RepID=A0A1S2Q960_9ACTN|nr:hypothetical protein BIV23_25200 [Streptomyces monashensis]